jgi:putative hemolysin
VHNQKTANMIVLEIGVVLALFVLNGFFAMAELAIVSSRRAHLERLVKEGRSGAQLALALANDPARMLAAIQIGFTTTAMLAGIFSGATLALPPSSSRPSPQCRAAMNPQWRPAGRASS